MKENIEITVIDRFDEAHILAVPLGMSLSLMEVPPFYFSFTCTLKYYLLAVKFLTFQLCCFALASDFAFSSTAFAAFSQTS